MSPQFSASHFTDTDKHIVELAADYIERLYGPSWSDPEHSGVVRWQYSQPESIGSFDGVNKPGARLLIAGDSLLGSRTEHAYDSGVRAAQMLLDLTSK
jgi:predicted NAD/FAD-dependent oxidoreductase